jgi:hypothetical protein
MAALTERRNLKTCPTRRQWGALALAGFGLAAMGVMMIAWHSTAKAVSVPVGARQIEEKLSRKITNVSICLAPTFIDGQAQAPVTTTATLFPFLDMVPSQDGEEVYVSARGVGQLGGAAFTNIGIGPGHNKGGWTMTYSDTVESYITTATGFTPNVDDYGPINITTTLGLDTGVVEFRRDYVPASTLHTLVSQDGKLELEIVSADTITVDTYILVVPSYAPPGPTPSGHRLVGSSYSVRAGGALPGTARPMLLRLYYDETSLAGADPHTLAIFRWSTSNRRWENVGGNHFADGHYLSAAVSQFATYALMATTTWRDDFLNDIVLSGLDEKDNVKWDALGGALVLSSAATSGFAVTKPITPTAEIYSWRRLSFTATVDPPTQTLTVDVLSLDGSEVLTDVANGTDLARLVDVAHYPSLRLRANMASSVEGETPALDGWQLAWQARNLQVHLPLVLK